ncbi:MAG: CPBP family intramembrane glutamic endopeptidase [Methanobacteriaceae archaeon]
MHFFSIDNHRKPFLKLVFKIIMALLLIQIARALVMGSLWYLFGSTKSLTLFQLFNGLSLIIVGVILLLWFKPSFKDLGLDWEDMNMRNRILYLSGIGFLIFMAFTPYTFTWDPFLLVIGLVFGIITPAFEEMLFRGYIWGKIEKTPEIANQGLLTWITVTLIFSIWHLGYLDVFLIHPQAVGNLAILMASKLAIGLVLGLLVGYARLKTGKTYLSIILHGLWNVMAP